MIDFLLANWLWIALIGAFVAMHRGGHGCGMHGSHGAGHGNHGHDHDGTTDSSGSVAHDDHASDAGAH